MIYAIGDIQGCFEPFQCLLKKINFNPDKDCLWLAGDLVNRGPNSLETLRFCYQRRENIIAVQGNHDLHLLAVAFDPNRDAKRKDTFGDILEAKDRKHLLDWLLGNPLLHFDPAHNAVMAHAGFPPMWDLKHALEFSKEVENVLADSKLRIKYFKEMYGNKPKGWDDKLKGPDRWRTITNYFTRMRLCDSSLNLDLEYKGILADKPQNLFPWFSAPNRIAIPQRILFGHWAALMGETNNQNVIGLDHGCVWGNKLSAYCLDTDEWHHCACNSQ